MTAAIRKQSRGPQSGRFRQQRALNVPCKHSKNSQRVCRGSGSLDTRQAKCSAGRQPVGIRGPGGGVGKGRGRGGGQGQDGQAGGGPGVEGGAGERAEEGGRGRACAEAREQSRVGDAGDGRGGKSGWGKETAVHVLAGAWNRHHALQAAGAHTNGCRQQAARESRAGGGCEDEMPSEVRHCTPTAVAAAVPTGWVGGGGWLLDNDVAAAAT